MKDAVVIWSALAPWLLLVWSFQRLSGLRGWAGALLSAVLASAVLFFPWFGHSLFHWSAGLSANFSVVMACLLVVGIAERASGCELFSRCEWDTAWIFGAVASLVLYPSAFGVGPRHFDAYALGWPWLFWRPSVLLFGGAAVVSAVLLWRGNRFGYLLLLTAAGYVLKFQESSNYWDYVLDPVYGAVSLLVVLVVFWRRFGRRHRDGEVTTSTSTSS